MAPDIRSFFGPKGGGALPAKPAIKKENDSAKKGRSKARKVVEDSDDDDEEPVEEKKPLKPAVKPKKPSNPSEVNGVETSASSYFASKSQPSKPQTTPKSTSKAKPNPAIEIRMSPRTKKPAAPKVEDPPPRAQNSSRQKKTTSYKESDGDDDAYVDEEDRGDDIFAADAKGRNKRKNDDYVEEQSEEEFLPKPKRVASRGSKAVVKDESDEDVKPNTKAKTNGKSPAAGKKRKSPPPEEEDDDEEEVKPRKKAAPAKPRAPKVKKEAEPESTEIQDILDNVPLIDAPDAPPKDPNFKFDFRKHAGGSKNAGPAPMQGALEIPEGAEDCLTGLSFVFTGQLNTIDRDSAQALVKRYGGKVTGVPSSKTSFVVLGDDAGPSKLRKIKEQNIKTINEEGLFYLIEKMPASGGSGKNAEKAKQKLEDEARKIREQAVEMEKEEKARKVEAEKVKKAAAAQGAVVSTPPPTTAQLWTTKYAPTQLSHICGNKGNVEKIQNWLQNWPKARKYDFQKRGADGMGGARAIIISGPPGIGKTTAAHLAAKLAGYDVIESNASDTRSKKLVENGLSDSINNLSILGYYTGDGKKVESTKKNTVLIMDEVDGMSAGDRGGVGALAKFCKKTEVPLILICNDRRLPKMKPFDFVAFDIKFTRPTVDQIRSRIMTICHREGLKLPPSVVNSIIEGSNKDIRQIINMISTAKLDQETMDYDKSKQMSKAWEKHVVLKPWDICQKMLGGGLFSPASKATLNDKIELYFNDHEFSYLMIQENYLSAKPASLGNNSYNPRERNLKHLELVDQAAESISDGDLVDRMIHGPQQHWTLMPTHAVFSTVKPASFMSGQLLGCSFTSWLGNNSKTQKLGRYNREIHSHMRLKSSGDHNEIRQQYLPVLWYQLIKRLEVEGKECIEDVIELMDSYYLTRDDFDAIKELGVGPQAEEKIDIETQTKATFTRTYNQMSHPIPFLKASNIGAATKASSASKPDLEEAIEEEDDGIAVEAADDVDDDDMDIKGDKYIKQPKAKAKPKAAAAKKTGKKIAKAADDDDEESEAPKATKGKGKGRGKVAKK